MNPQVFGKEHLIYIAISVIVAFVTIFLSKLFGKNDKTKKLIIKISAAILFIIIFTNRWVLVFEYDTVNWKKLIPDSFCSVSSFVLSLSLLFGKKNNNVLHFIWLIALAGGTITTFYPNFIGQNPSFMYPPTIFGMLHHTWSAIVIILILIFNYLEITYKKWYCTLFGFTAYLSFGTFLMCVLKFDNPFYMTGPALDGTIFTIWVISPIYVVIYSLILLIVELFKQKSINVTDNYKSVN